MDAPFPPGTPPGTLHPAPAEEQARLHRMLAQHMPPPAPFDAAVPPGSFNGPLAERMGAAEPVPENGPQVKMPFTFAF